MSFASVSAGEESQITVLWLFLRTFPPVCQADSLRAAVSPQELLKVRAYLSTCSGLVQLLVIVLKGGVLRKGCKDTGENQQTHAWNCTWQSVSNPGSCVLSLQGDFRYFK